MKLTKSVHKLLLWSIMTMLFIIVPVLMTNAQTRTILGREIKCDTWKGKEIEYVAGQLLVKLKPDVSKRELRPFLLQQGAEIGEDFDRLRWGLIEFPENVNIFEKMDILKSNSLIETVEPNRIGYASSNIPNDPLFEEQWALRNSGPFQRTPPYNYGKADADIDAPEAWDIETGNSTVVIAVLDHGIAMENGQPCHPDLDDPNKIILGTDFTNDGSGVKDEFGHGTHVAGIAAAETDNNTGIAGVSWGSKILVIQVFTMVSGKPTTTLSILENGICAAVDSQKAHPSERVVINLSGGVSSDSISNTILEDAVMDADTNDCLLIAAVGNETGFNIHIPALFASYGTRPGHSTGYKNVIAVSGTTVRDEWGPYSRYKVPWDPNGIGVTVAAPGGDYSPVGPSDETWILSTVPYYIEEVYYMGGWATSMATPHVAGVAALILSKYPALHDWEVRQIIEQSAEDVNHDLYPGVDKYLGYGRINAFRALVYASAYVNHLIVPDDYTDIQDAIDVASSGQFVFVKAGNYNESIRMKSGVTVVGAGSNVTTINAEIISHAVSFSTVTDCRIHGFKIKNTFNDSYAIKCWHIARDEVSIENCEIVDCPYIGIFAYAHSHPEIRETKIRGNRYGIYARYCSDPELYHGYNEISNNQYGVYCENKSEPGLGYYYESFWGMNSIKENSINDVRAKNNCATIHAVKNYWGEDIEPDVHHESSTHVIVCDDPLHNDPLGKMLADPQVAGNDAKEHNLKGRDLYFQGKYEQALAEFFYVIDNYPETQEALFALDNVVTTYRKMGTKTDAVAYLENLAQKQSSNMLGGQALEQTIPFELEKGNYRLALSRIDALLQSFSKTEMALHLLLEKGMIYKYYIGDQEQASRIFRAFIEKYSDDELAKLAQAELDSPYLPKFRNQGLAEGKATSFSLSQSYPNPANPSTTINFALPEAVHVRLEIYNLLGQRVKTLVQGVRPAGSHTAVWNGRDESGKVVSSGIYLYHLKCHWTNSRPGSKADFVRVKKLLLIR